jgi:hypothetical protein
MPNLSAFPSPNEPLSAENIAWIRYILKSSEGMFELLKLKAKPDDLRRLTHELAELQAKAAEYESRYAAQQRLN